MPNHCFAVYSYQTRKEMGNAAATAVADIMVKLLNEKEHIAVVFAAAPSQNEMLSALITHTEVDFTRIVALHMDEYIGFGPKSKQSFAYYLYKHIFNLVPFREIHYIRGDAKDLNVECARYTSIFNQWKPDLVCMGIGENGHVAFNDPPVAEFHDRFVIKQVELDPVCRMQQVHDGCFQMLEDVPTQALTLTIPALMSASHHICVVPSISKAQAVYNTVYGPISEKTPSSVLRLSPDARLFLDNESACLL